MNGELAENSKYIRKGREENAFCMTSVLFLFSMFVMPQYFGVPFPLFDFTLLRIFLLVVLFVVFSVPKRTREFWNLILGCRELKIFLPYLIVVTYTMVLRHDFKAFFNPFMEILAFIVLLYAIRTALGTAKTIRLLLIFCYILTILGLIEYAMGKSPFSYLETIEGVLTANFVRSGQYRIMSSQIHSLGYGLMLVTCVPFACLDLEKNEVYLFKRPVLLILLILNIFLTGSRSTLIVLFVEVVLLLALSEKENTKKVALYLIPVVVISAVAIVALQGTGIGKYIMLQLTTLVDSIFGTTYSVAYGADISSLGASSNYREQLKYIFKVSWLNPLLGIGRSRSFSTVINGTTIKSVDSFYIAEYIRYAYPGMLAYIAILGTFIVRMVQNIKRTNSAVVRILLTALIGYAINLYWVDSLQTLKYLYILFALFITTEMEEHGESGKDYFHRGNSKYIKK